MARGVTQVYGLLEGSEKVARVAVREAVVLPVLDGPVIPAAGGLLVAVVHEPGHAHDVAVARRLVPTVDIAKGIARELCRILLVVVVYRIAAELGDPDRLAAEAFLVDDLELATILVLEVAHIPTVRVDGEPVHVAR